MDTGCAILSPIGRGLCAEDQVNDLEDQDTILYANHRRLFLSAYVYTVLLYCYIYIVLFKSKVTKINVQKEKVEL